MAAGFDVNDPVGLRPGPTTPHDGWKVDKDWWHFRPLRPSDRFNRNGCISIHMFTQDGFVYCRDAAQAKLVDAGRIPS